MDDDEGTEWATYKVVWNPSYRDFLKFDDIAIETSYRRVEPQNDMRVISDLTKEQDHD